MTGICTKCGTEHRVPGTRGTRLADFRSPCCSALMRGPTAGKSRTTKGKRFAKCDICGRRHLAQHLYIVDGAAWRYATTALPTPEAIVCGHHYLVQAHTGTRRLLAREVGRRLSEREANP